MTKKSTLISKQPGKKLVITLLVFAAFFLPNLCFASNYDYIYGLLDHPDGSTSYQLTVSVTSSLYEYYRSKDHNLYSRDDFAKFVTPSALKPIADDLWSIYGDDEDFANGVLMIVHQIPYVESGPQKYPVETVVENEGDCDLLSFIAASVMLAGGLDVVLLLYEAQSHMNVGVSLSHEPYDARSTVYYHTCDGKPYYLAECTGGNWRSGWRVGESPDMLFGASAHLITLENHEQTSPGQVSSSYGTLTASSVSLTLSSEFLIAGSPVKISGSISPVLAAESVTIYLSSGDSTWVALTKVTTDSDGRYSYVWKSPSAGRYFIKASWSGDANYQGADSHGHSLLVLPLEWLMMGITVVIALSVLLIVSVVTRRKSIEEIGFSAETEVFEEY